MPDLFVSTSGTDTAGGGDTSASALRSITFAINEAARRFGSARVAIRLAAGTYDNSGGESFPLELAQNISLIGAGVGSSIVFFERSLASGFEAAISGGEELTGFTLQGLPRDLGSCYRSAGINQTMGTTWIHDVVVEAAPGTPAGDVGFGLGIAVHNDGRVEDVTVDGCNYGIAFSSDTARILRCTVRNSQRGGVSAAGGGTVSDCDLINNHKGVLVSAGAPRIEGNRINGNTWGIELRSDAAVPEVRSNDIENNYMSVACFGEAALIEDNDIRTASSHYGVLVGTGISPSRGWGVTTPIAPEVRNNRFRRTAGGVTFPRPQAVIGGASRPVFEGNLFASDAGPFAFLEVHADAVPDLGSRRPGSMGGNRFAAGHMVFYQDPLAPPKTIPAQDNFWRRLPLRRGYDLWTPRDWYVDPVARRDSITLDTSGGRTI